MSSSHTPPYTPPTVVAPLVAFYRMVEPLLASERLSRFSQDPTRRDPERVILARYLYNLALCQAFYPPLHLFEVVLRNATCRAACTRRPGTGALDTATGRLDSWLDDNSAQSLLLPIHQHEVAATKRTLVRLGYALTEGRLVATLKFGFWTGLFSGPYGDPMPSRLRLWPSLLSVVFPHLPPSYYQRKRLAARLNRVRQLRNRIFHHEPIWRRNVSQDEADIVEILSWMSPEAAQLARVVSRVGEAVRAALTPHEQALKRLVAELK